MSRQRIVYRIAKHRDGHVQLIVEGVGGGNFDARRECGFSTHGYDTVGHLPRYRALTL